MLDTAYDFCRKRYLEDRPSFEGIIQILQTGSLIEIFDCIDYGFHPRHKDLMIQCIKIVFQRAFFDKKACSLFRFLVLDGSHAYAEQIFETALKSGNFFPFDTSAMALYRLMCRTYILINYLIDPSPDRMDNLSKLIRKIDLFLTKALENPKGGFAK